MQIFRNLFSDLTIPAGEHWQVIDLWQESEGVRNIIVEENAKLDYLALSDNAQVKIILSHQRDARSTVSGIVLGEQKGALLDMESVLQEDRAYSNMHLVAYLIAGSKVTLNGNIRIQPDIKDCEGYLLQENLILGKNIQIKTLPQLDVRSHNVRASHGARIEGMDEKKLFYLMSKGIAKADAQKLMIDGSLSQLFACFGEHEEVLQLKTTLLERIVSI